MDAPKCKICQERHYGLCPSLAATKPTAARKDVRDNSKGPGARAATADPVAATTPPAGTQALPVDTKRKRGRPPTGFDKKAHDAKKARERRAAQKAQGKETT